MNRRAFFSARSARSGSALLIILGCVALLTILVVAFLASARTEFSTSNFYAKSVNTKLLSENVINLVMAQLREGARSTDVITTAPQAWASQPGMIRTYGTDGMPYKYFKLYSWDNMVGSLGFDETASGESPPTNWASMPNIFTDLNEPVNGNYPILDPAAQGNVEGFSLDPPPGFTTATNLLPMPVKWLYVLKDGTVTVGTPIGTGTAVHVPAASVPNPVIGRVAFWTDDETSKVDINTASEGTFWDQPVGDSSEEMGTLSQTANTQGNGPTISPPYGYATSLPAGEEFQRMPGHPATTSLSAVFGFGLSPVLPDTSTATWPLTPTTYASKFAPYYSVTPRYAAGGSMSGAQAPEPSFAPPGYRLYDSVDELVFDPSRINLAAANPALYPASPGVASPSGRASLAITPQVIEQSRFFITAHSRAPEETLFGTPRISLWPLQAQAVARTAKDNLLAFCSTINDQPYYFQRATYYGYQQNASSSPILTPDPQGLFPGYSSSQSATQDFPGAPTTTPQTGAGRNENLYAYLQALTGGTSTMPGSDIPGFGGNFLAKYPGVATASDRDEILTQMFDLLRSGVNTFNVAPGLYPHYTFSPLTPAGNYNPGVSSTVPIAITTNGGSSPNTHGLGRTFDVAEVSLVFMAAAIDLNDGHNGFPIPAAGQPDPQNPSTYSPPSAGASAILRRQSIGPNLPWAVERDYGTGFPSTPTPTYFTYNANGTTVTIGDPQTTAIQAFLLVRPFSLLPGAPPLGANVRIRITNLNSLSVSFPDLGGSTTGSSLGFPVSNNAVASYVSYNFGNASSMGSLLESSVGDGGQIHPLGTDTGDIATNFQQYNPSVFRGKYPFFGQPVALPRPAYPSPFGGQDPLAISAPTLQQIHQASNPIRPDAYAGTTMTIDPNPNSTAAPVSLKIEVLDGVNPLGTAQPVQTIYVAIPNNMVLPVPTVEMANVGIGYSSAEALAFGPPPGPGGSNSPSGPRIPAYGGAPAGTPPATSYQSNSYPAMDYYWQLPFDPRIIANRFATDSAGSGIINRGDVVRSFVVNPTYVPKSTVAGDMRLLGANPIQLPITASGSPSDLFVPLGSSRSPAYYSTNPSQGPSTDLFIKQLHALIWESGSTRNLLTLAQTSKFILAGNGTTAATSIGALWMPWCHNGTFGAGMGETDGALFQGETYAAGFAPDVTPELNGAFMDTANTIPGDWTTGIGGMGDGPFIGKPDEGTQAGYAQAGSNLGSIYFIPYYDMNIGNQAYDLASISYSPNRQVPSAVIFGTLPSRAMQGVPWCTLLFCPNPAANDTGAVHPGFGKGSGTGTGAPGPNDSPPYLTGSGTYYGGPPDHLWLDLFWMPVVEPYAISEPFSTAGKVNMNYEIVPFWSYIHRSTALYAVMKSTRIIAIPADGVLSSSGINANGAPVGPAYSSGNPIPTGDFPSLSTATTATPTANWPNIKGLFFTWDTPPVSYSYRYGINLKATIDDTASAFYQRFHTLHEIFRSATEICNVFLVPETVAGSTYFPGAATPPTDASYASMAGWWKNFKLTGDNERESPYSQIYPRLTTKSNTFEVHMRVQVLSQTPADRANGNFDLAGGDTVVGEYRGSAIVERYLDPNQTTLPDFATTFPADPTSTLDNYVHYRVVSTRAFSP